MSRRGAKRAGAPPASAPPAQRVRRGPQPSGDNAARLAEEMEARAFWDTISTDFLYTWATDYNSPQAQQLPRERNALLKFLVETDGVEVPDGSVAQQHAKLVRVWRKREGKRGGAHPPVVFSADTDDEQQDEQQDVQQQQPAGGDARPAGSQQLEQLTPPSTPPLNQQQHVDERERPPASDPMLAVALEHIKQLKVQLAAKGTASPALPAPPARICLVCGSPSPPGAPAGSDGGYNCANCGLRGDLPLSHAANQFLSAKLTGLGAPAPAPASSISSSSSGQSATVHRPSLSALDQSLARMLERGVAVPLFSGPAAGDTVPYAQALQLTARAYEASKYQPPSEHLVALIRAGKLREVGYALPRPHLSLAGALEAEAGTVALSGGTMQFINKVPVAPAVATSQQFCMALFSVILPALADRPRAMLEWITLGHTALALEASHSWAVASLYLQRTLAAAIEAGAPFATEVNTNVLLPIVLSAPSQRGGGAGGPAGGVARGGGAGAGGGGGAVRPCYNWNADLPCSRQPCAYAHVCQACEASGHKGPACPIGGGGAGPRRAPTGSSSVYSRNSRGSKQRHVQPAASSAGGAPPAAS